MSKYIADNPDAENLDEAREIAEELAVNDLSSDSDLEMVFQQRLSQQNSRKSITPNKAENDTPLVDESVKLHFENMITNSENEEIVDDFGNSSNDENETVSLDSSNPKRNKISVSKSLSNVTKDINVKFSSDEDCFDFMQKDNSAYTENIDTLGDENICESVRSNTLEDLISVSTHYDASVNENSESYLHLKNLNFDDCNCITSENLLTEFNDQEAQSIDKLCIKGNFYYFLNFFYFSCKLIIPKKISSCAK